MTRNASARSAYPLAWPDHWPRTKTPTGSAFRTSLSSALENVRKSLELFARDSGRKVTDVLISSNVSLGDQRPKDSGVAIYFTWDELPTCIAVDRYVKVEDNLQAIHHVLEAERTKLRHGGLNLVRAAFQGYAKLPPPSAPPAGPAWWTVLGIAEGATLIEAERAYRELRSVHHPDHGGDPDKFHQCQLAILEARRVLGARS